MKETSRSTSWRVIAVITLVAIAAVILVRLMIAPAVAGDGETCGSSMASEVSDVIVPSVLLPAEQELVNFVWVYDADDTVHRITSLLHWHGPAGRPQSLRNGEQLPIRLPKALANESNSESIPEDQVRASAVVIPNGVSLSVCVDTSGAPPDRYTSALTFEDTEIQAAPFTIDVTVKNRDEWIPMAAVIIGIAIALILLVLSLASATVPKSTPAIVAIVVAGLLTLLVGMRPWETWQNDPTWGNDRFDWVLLAAATALALAGAIATGDTIQGFVKAVSDAKDDEAKTAPSEQQAQGEAAPGETVGPPPRTG